MCADPDNLPYSHENGTGFENRLAQLVSRELGEPLRYFWLPLRRGFVRKTLGAHECDVLIGVPTNLERVLATKPYYRSTYVFVSRKEQPPADFAALKNARVGVQLVGNDLAATPPGYALARSGVVDNVVGYTVYGDGPAAERMVNAIARGELDVALVWGPQAGYFAQRAKLQVVPAKAPPQALGMPFEFSISMGVRRGERALRDRLDAVIDARRADIAQILAAYQVPVLP